MKNFPIILALLIFMTAAVSHASAADISAFKLKGGRIYKGGEELKCDVNEVPSEIGGPIRYWSAFGPDASDSVTEAEAGVWFFASDGRSLTFVPIEYCQEVIFSPDGGRFVLSSGGDYRPEMSYEVYGEATEKILEFDGVRGQLAWFDPVRFVATRIDDAREEGSEAYNLRTSLRLSVVMYDAAMRETTVLKEATNTQNFWFPEVTPDGSAVAITEDSVKSAKDWDDEDKIERREIRIEIPQMPPMKTAGSATTPTTAPAQSSGGSANNSLREQANELLNLINAERKKVGAPALRIDETLQRAANRRASELITKYSHDRPDGRAYHTVFAEFNLTPQTSAENIAWRSGKNNTGMAAFNKTFMDSTGHRTNMLNRDYSTIGLGIAQAGDRYYVVELFADNSIATEW